MEFDCSRTNITSVVYIRRPLALRDANEVKRIKFTNIGMSVALYMNWHLLYSVTCKATHKP